jgi:hypothetical protein
MECRFIGPFGIGISLVIRASSFVISKHGGLDKFPPGANHSNTGFPQGSGRGMLRFSLILPWQNVLAL